MANIYDVNAAIQKPNMLGAVNQGMQIGQQQRALKEQRLDQQQLRNLAPGIISGDPNAFSEAAAINPEAAGEYQSAGDSQLRRMKGFVAYVDQAREQARRTGDMRAVNAALQQGAPYISKILGKPAPTEWTPDMEPGWAGLKAKIAMAESGGSGTGILSTYVDDQGRRVAVNRDGTTTVLGGADQGMSNQTITVTGPDGRPAQYTFNKRTGSYEPASMGGAGSQGATQFMGPDGMPVQIGADIPPAIRQDIMNNPAGWNAAPDMGTANLPPQQSQGPSPFVGRSPEEDAAAVEAAKQGVQLQALPQRQAIETRGAIDKARGVGEVKQELERAEGAPKRVARYEQALATAENVGTSVNRAMQMIGPTTTGFLGARMRGVEGSPAYNLAAEIETIKANLGFDRLQQMRDNSPTGGALGQVAIQELVALQSTVANLDPDQSAEQLQQNLQRIQGHYDRWQAAVQQALMDERSQGASNQSRGPQPGSVEEGYRFRGGDPADPNNWERM